MGIKINLFGEFMLTYEDFPPINFFLSALKNHPETAYLYLNIWDARDYSNRLTVDKDYIRNHYHVSSTIFRNHCFLLRDLEILFITESPKRFDIVFSA